MEKTHRLRDRFLRNWFIVTSLVTKDFKLKYRRSVLGVIWSVLNPLLMMVILTFVFGKLLRFEIENYALYIILGLTLYTFMSEATQRALMSIIDSAPLIKKIRISKWLFPIQKVLSSLVNYAISLISVAAVMVFFRVAPTPNLLLLPLLLLYVSVFSLGLGLLVSAINVYLRDTEHIWSVLTLAWMYATPIIYPVEALETFAPNVMFAMQFNPMYHYVSYMREIALLGTTPGLVENILCLGFALITLLVGALVFKKLSKRFVLFV